jgi:hypothetical protein
MSETGGMSRLENIMGWNSTIAESHSSGTRIVVGGAHGTDAISSVGLAPVSSPQVVATTGHCAGIGTGVVYDCGISRLETMTIWNSTNLATSSFGAGIGSGPASPGAGIKWIAAVLNSDLHVYAGSELSAGIGTVLTHWGGIA